MATESTAPAPAGAVRPIHIHVVIFEPVDHELPEQASPAIDGAMVESVRTVLLDNGYKAVAALVEGTWAPVPDGTWPMWARQLDRLLTEVAQAERVATVAYAEAFLAAEGTQQARAAAADLAAAAAVENHATLSGRAEAYRMVLASRARTDAHSAPVVTP